MMLDGFGCPISPVKVDFYVQDVPEVAWDLIEVADKPLTIIYSGARNLASNLIAEDGSVGIQVTNEEFSKRLCQQFRKAIVSTSANISGQPSPANYSEITGESTNTSIALLSERCLISYTRRTASSLVASQPMPQMVSVGYRMTPPSFIT